MRTIIQILIVGGLTLGMAYAQETTESARPVVNAAAVSAAEPAPVAVAAAPADVPAVVDASRKQYVAGDYAHAEEGFNAVLKADPRNPIAAFYLSKLAGLRHRTAEETALKQTDQEWDMILRYYPVTDRFVKNMKLEENANAKDLERQLAKASVEFPEGSSVRYLPEIQKLFVENTPANLEKVEKVLAAFGAAEAEASAEQVKIEARFVEFNEGALQELGFEWKDNTDNGKGIGGKWSVENGQDLFTDSLRTLPYAQTGTLGLGETRATGAWRANRIEDMFNSAAGGSGVNPNGTGNLSLSGKVGGNEVDLLIKALDQTSGADVLSAPSVTTLSGQPAVITVGERHFYPETYEAGESQGTVLHVKYQDFKEKILGVEMTVTPTIKGDEIQMKINPKINELLGWQKFELASADTSYTYYQYRIGEQFEHEAVVAQLPLFNRREVKTEVSAASGSTIGMGGLIGEKTEAFSDRVPVLGSIPLIGRIFRSEGSRTVKRNLMIFVTASKVAPNGRIISERSFEK